jgi:hypothetical protein
MCFLEHPALVLFSRCRHRVWIPEDEQARPVQCHEYQGTTQWHDPLVPGHAASSTNRREKCPKCVRSEQQKATNDKEKKTDEDKDEGEEQGIARPVVNAN